MEFFLGELLGLDPLQTIIPLTLSECKCRPMFVTVALPFSTVLVARSAVVLVVMAMVMVMRAVIPLTLG